MVVYEDKVCAAFEGKQVCIPIEKYPSDMRLREMIKDEEMTAREYDELGLTPLAVEEAKHAKFFRDLESQMVLRRGLVLFAKKLRPAKK